jgi:phage baseplate assembly protein W
MRFNVQGEPLLIENENLLYQAALKILLTRKGSNPFHTQYGSQIMSRIGNKAVGAVAMLINEDVRTALANMQAYQAAQAKYQIVTAKERLYSIQSVNVYPHDSDPTAFMVDIVVSNASGEPISLTIVFTVPGAVALAGSNGLSLGIETTGLR